MRWGMLVDLRKCIGCHACTVACQQEHKLPLGEKWNKVLRVGPEGRYPNLKSYFLPVPCMHCEEAPCVEGCPTGASLKRADGIVIVDASKCVGCKFCMVVCPYDVRYFNEEKGVVEKCVMCFERVDQGEVPRCVETCQLKARYFGDLDDPESEIVQLIHKRNARPLHEDLGTKPAVYYIFP